MSFKVFCAQTEGKGGKTYYRGYAGKGIGGVFVFEGTREKDGMPLMVVSIPRAMSLLKSASRARSFRRRRTGNNSYYNKSKRY